MSICWKLCLQLVKLCLPRHDITKELAPYLQHAHRAPGVYEETQRTDRRWVTNRNSIQGLDMTIDGQEINNRYQPLNTPNSDTIPEINKYRELNDIDEEDILKDRYSNVSSDYYDSNENSDSEDSESNLPLGLTSSRQRANTITFSKETSSVFITMKKKPMKKKREMVSFKPKHDQHARQHEAITQYKIIQKRKELEKSQLQGKKIKEDGNENITSKQDSKNGKIRTPLGDALPVRWDKVILVQIAVDRFAEMYQENHDLMAEAKVLYDHTVLSRLREYRGQEILSDDRTGVFLIAFASEFHAAKWCLSLQSSLVYAAWNDKLLKAFPNDLAARYAQNILPEGQSTLGSKKFKKQHVGPLLYKGFRVRMVIHCANPHAPIQSSLHDAVQWTQTVIEYGHGGQIILSNSVWDGLKEQLVQLGNPVVEDLGCHVVLDENVMLMLLLPREFESRRFPKLNSPQQILLGIRDAPSAHKPVTMVFTFIEGARSLIRDHAVELAGRIKVLCIVARELLQKHKGYECQELQGDFMLAFFHASDAIMWCAEYQLRIKLLFKEWSKPLPPGMYNDHPNDPRARHDQTEMQESNDRKTMEFSMSMGIETGLPASVSPHKTSGRADYFGNIVNQTARIAKAAHGGQILIGGDAWNAFMESQPIAATAGDATNNSVLENSTFILTKQHGYFSFKGISKPVALVEAIPIENSSRAVAKLTNSINFNEQKASRGVPRKNIASVLGTDGTNSSPKNEYVEEALKQLPRLPKAPRMEDHVLARSLAVPGSISPALARVPNELLRLPHFVKKELDTIRGRDVNHIFMGDGGVTILDDDEDENEGSSNRASREVSIIVF